MWRFIQLRCTRWLRGACLIAAISLLAIMFSFPSHAKGVEASMCVECDALNAQLRIVREKRRSFEEGRKLLVNTQKQFRRDVGNADRFASAYMALQGTSIVVGVATLPCDVPTRWLKGLIGGASGLGSYIQDADMQNSTLASIVAFLGFGVVSDALSFLEFSREYSEGADSNSELDRHMQATIRRFDSVLAKLEREEDNLVSNRSRGGCDGEAIDFYEMTIDRRAN